MSRPRIDWYGKSRMPKAPKPCPRCGGRMISHAIYYECPGCGYTENAPRTGPKRDVQPVDNLAARRRPREPAGDAWQSEFALAVVPPTMATEFRWLGYVGWVIVLFCIGSWGVAMWTGVIADLDVLFVMCWQVCVLGAIILALALLHSSRFMKQLGIVVALLMIPVCILADVLLSIGHEVEILIAHSGLTGSIEEMFSIHVFAAAAIYCAWLAWYPIRERRLQGW